MALPGSLSCAGMQGTLVLRVNVVSTVTVLAPIIGAAIILIAPDQRAGHPAGGRWGLPAIAVLALVLLGVAAGEGRTRVWAPDSTQPL